MCRRNTYYSYPLHFFVPLRVLRASREHLCRLRRVVRLKVGEIESPRFTKSKIRLSEAHDPVAQFHRKAAPIQILQRERSRGGELFFEHLFEPGNEFARVAFHRVFEVQAQAARIPVGGADQGPGAVDEEQLRMVERRWRQMYPATPAHDLR